VEKSRLKKQSENSRKIRPEPTFKESRLAKFSRHVFVCTNFREPGSARPSCTTDVWYGGVKVEDVPEIVSEHLIAGRPIERLRIANDCLNAAVCPHRPALANRA
jgi:(2Fe-2S) ferredoxin